MTALEAHRNAEALAGQAEAAKRDGDRAKARAIYTEAARWEAQAIAGVSPSQLRTLGIIAVSLVSLQYKAHLFEEAEQTAYRFLSAAGLSTRARTQLRELLEVVWDEQILLKHGLIYSGQEIVVSLRGGAVGSGTAPLSLAMHVQSGVNALITRIAEFVGQFDFRVRGPLPKEFTDRMQLRVAAAQVGSYRFTVKLAEPDHQLEMFSARSVDARRVGNTFMKLVGVAVEGEQHDLEELIPNADYRLATLQLLRNVAPRGSSFQELDFIHRNEAQEPEVIRLNSESRHRIADAVRTQQPDATKEVLHGVLRGLQLDKKWLEVVLDDGKTIRCTTPLDMLDDVVGPWVNHRVRVRGEWSSPKKFVAHDVDEDPGEDA